MGRGLIRSRQSRASLAHGRVRGQRRHAFTVLAEPTRRRILDELRVSERSVGELTQALAQPAVSKHLEVLRDSGFVSCRTAAQHRIYRVESRAFEALDAWLAPSRQLWTRHLDALEQHVDRDEET